MKLGEKLDTDLILRDSDYWLPIMVVTICTAFLAAGYPLSEQAEWLSSLFLTIVWIGFIGYSLFCGLHVAASVALHLLDFKPGYGTNPHDPTKVPLVSSINKSRFMLNFLIIINILMLYYGKNGLGPSVLGMFVIIMVLRRVIKHRSNYLIQEKLRA